MGLPPAANVPHKAQVNSGPLPTANMRRSPTDSPSCISQLATTSVAPAQLVAVDCNTVFKTDHLAAIGAERREYRRCRIAYYLISVD